MSSAKKAPSSASTAQLVAGELRDFTRAHEMRRRQFPRALAVGIITGLVAVAFRFTLEHGSLWRNALYGRAHALGLIGIVFPMLFSALLTMLAVWLTRRFAPETSGSGIPHLKAVLHRLRGLSWTRILPVKFGGGVAAVTAGLALGREGPTIQMGGAVGQMVGEYLGGTAREKQTLIAAGAGAGLAAAFNAPIAGLVFVLEEVQRDFTPTVFTAAFIASVTGDVIGRLLLGQLPVFHIAQFPVPPLTALPAFLILGILAGVLSVVFNRALLLALDGFARLGKQVPPPVLAGVIGALIGGVGWFLPATLGGGHELVEQVLTRNPTLLFLLGLFVLRFVMTMLSYGTGAAGGIFAPLLVLGAQLGLAVGLMGQRIAPGVILHPEAFAVVGMGAYFTGIVRAPLTGIILIVEMTGNYSLTLPLLVACLTAYGVADLLRDPPIYDALLERDLLRTEKETPHLEESLLLELSVHEGAPFVGKRIRDLGLPPGCILVTIRRGVRDEIPTAEMRLETGDRITAVVSPQAAQGVALLREGTEAPGH